MKPSRGPVKLVSLSVVFVLFSSYSPSFAEISGEEKTQIEKEAIERAAEAQKKAAVEVETKKAERRTNDFAGLNFGVGVGIVGTPSNRLARTAQVINGVVRVDDSPTVTASILLESHYFFTGDHPKWGHGPFVALRSGGETNQVIDSIGVGYMVGFRYKETSPTSWNIGAGLSVTPNAKTLGDGVSRNEPLPLGETEVRFKNRSLLGFMVLASFSWNSFGD